MQTIVGNAELIKPGVEHINRTGGVVAGALPLLYGMAEGIVAGVTYDRQQCPTSPSGAAGRRAPPDPAARRCRLPAERRGRRERHRRAHVAGEGSRPVVSGPVVGAVYSPIHSSFHAWSYCCSLQLG